MKNAPKMGVFPHLWPPKILFQKSGSVTFVPLWCPNFMQKIRKTNERSLRYLKMDRRTTDGRTRAITKDPLGRNRGPKWLFDSFPLMFFYNLAKKQLSNIFFEKIIKIFQFLTILNSKIYNFQKKKGLSNLMQASIINKACWFLA